MDAEHRAIVHEVGTVTFAAFVYFGVRVLVEGSTRVSEANADRMLRLERRLGIDIETAAQDLVLDHDWLRTLGNLSYVWLHWPLVIAVLVIVFRRDREIYLRLRRALCASGAVGLMLFWLMPTAPPRFMPGFEGTVSDSARTHYLNYPLGWANQYAAFPSFHVGWTLIACLALAATITARWARPVILIPAALVALAVVTTGNHYVVDALAGVLIALVAYRWFGRDATRPDTSPVHTDPANDGASPSRRGRHPAPVPR